jgi:hypothetical protein
MHYLLEHGFIDKNCKMKLDVGLDEVTQRAVISLIDNSYTTLH